MNLPRAPITLGIAIATVLATIGLGGTHLAQHPALSWLVHTDVVHLLTDLIPWLVLGLWLEPRNGSVRWAVWTALAVLLSASLHGVFYPAQSAVFGLSAAIYAVAFAGLIAWRAGASSDPRRWTMIALLAILLLDELIRGTSAWHLAIDDSWRGTRFVNMDRFETTPLLHAAAAAMGMLLGLGAAANATAASSTTKQAPTIDSQFCPTA